MSRPVGLMLGQPRPRLVQTLPVPSGGRCGRPQSLTACQRAVPLEKVSSAFVQLISAVEPRWVGHNVSACEVFAAAMLDDDGPLQPL